MSLSPPSRIESGVPAKKIRFDDFDISWVGQNPDNGAYLFGSDDGRIRKLDIDGNIDTSLSISLTLEAINGVAFSGRVRAVSTRAEIVFIIQEENGEGLLRYDGGAHDILTISSGGLIAPLGRNGILTMVPIDGSAQVLATINVGKKHTNFYKIAHCHGDGQNDLIVGAARHDGLLVLGLKTASDRIIATHGHFLQSPRLDVIDVCSLGSAAWPNAAAWLGADSSIHLSRDIVADYPSKSLRLKELQGAAYSLLQACGHLFLLTNKALYVFQNVVDYFLDNNEVPKIVPAVSMYGDFVEIFVCSNDLCLLSSEFAQIFPIEAIASGVAGANANTWSPQIIDEPMFIIPADHTMSLSPV